MGGNLNKSEVRLRSEKAYNSIDREKCKIINLIIDLVYNMYNVSVREVVEARCPEVRSRNERDILGHYKIPDT
jgi:hypothetical protein